MPEYEYVKAETGSIADGASETVTDTLDEKKHLEKIVVSTNQGVAANKSVAEIKIDNAAITDPDVPLAMLAPAVEPPFSVERDVTKGQKVNVKITNHEAAATVFWVTFVYTLP